MAMVRRPDAEERCVNGHELTPDVKTINKKGSIVCRICARAAVRASYLKHKERRRAEASEYQRAHREQARDRMRAARSRRGEEFREKRRARDKVKKALLSGALVRGECELLSGECHGRIEAHHDDYAKPLDVRWLCASHHRILH